MNLDDQETIALPIGVGAGVLAAFWVVAWLVHIGPSLGPDSPWWAFPYYMTAVLGGSLATLAVVGGVFSWLTCLLLERYTGASHD